MNIFRKRKPGTPYHVENYIRFLDMTKPNAVSVISTLGKYGLYHSKAVSVIMSPSDEKRVAEAERHFFAIATKLAKGNDNEAKEIRRILTWENVA